MKSLATRLKRGFDGLLAGLRRPASTAVESDRLADLREAIDVLPEGLVFLDPERRYILWNKKYEEIYQKSADLFRPGAKFEDTLRIGVARGDYPQAIGREAAWLEERLALLKNPGTRHEQRLSDGRWVLIEERRTRNGGTIGIRVDVTDLKRREASFRLLFEANPVPMFLVEAGTLLITAMNEAARAHYQFAAVPPGMALAELYAPEEREALARVDWNEPAAAHERTWFHRTGAGDRIEVSVMARALDYEGQATIVLAAIDVTERRLAEARIAHMAKHDALTNLPNRLLYREKVEEALADLAGRGAGFALLLIDLDHFKTVNDTLGHSVGDRLLELVATRVRGCLAPTDLLARLGGDEFALLLSGSDRGTFAATAEDLVTALRAPFAVERHLVTVGASIGIAVAPEHGADPERLLKSADMALYRAKAGGRDTFRFFSWEMDEQLQARQALESDLRECLRSNQLTVEYQPLVTLGTGAIAGFEALLRWRHPVRGNVPPGEFIPIAEETGLIDQIGEMVLSRACRDAANWPDHVVVAVNLSPIQFKTTRILDTVVQALSASRLRPGRLELEITEALLMEKSEAVMATLHALRALGVGISMDDFGTGYSSLSYLRSFPFTKIKIDKSFVREVSVSPESQAIVKAIVGLGGSLGMTVTAEGIENPADLEYLLREGCSEGQGYLFSRAQPASSFAFPAAVSRRSSAA